MTDKSDEQAARTEVIRKYDAVFKRHGFDRHDIDFSSVSPAAIRAMAKSLESLERESQRLSQGGPPSERIASALERIAAALEGPISITMDPDDYLVVDRKNWDLP